jgi:hypothetical protein
MNTVEFRLRMLKTYLCFNFLMYLFYGVCLAKSPVATKKEARKTLIVTGASGELGAATARILAPDHNLILTGRDLAKLKSL